MLLNEIKKQITYLPQDEANKVRDLYIENFIDVTKQGYKSNIVDKLLFSDGYCYTGYLWDYLKKYHRISIQSFINELLYKDTVLVF
jgi:hypothetical protein